MAAPLRTLKKSTLDLGGGGVYTCHLGAGAVGLMYFRILGTHLGPVARIIWEYYGSGLFLPSLVVSIPIKHSLPYYSAKTSSRGPLSN